MKRFLSFSRHSFGVRNRSPWRSMLGRSLHQFHENDLFTSAAAMSYFGLMALFPALLLMLALSNKLAAGSQLLTHAVDVYPGSSKFLRETIGAFRNSDSARSSLASSLVFWAGSWVFAVVERALNRIWGAVSRTFLHGRALTIGMVGIVGLLFSLSVLMTSILVALREISGRFSLRQIRTLSVVDFGGQCVLASVVCNGKLSDHCCALCPGLSFHAERRGYVTRHSAGCVSGRLALGAGEVHLRLEPELFSLRSDLWFRGRRGCSVDVELRVEFDTAVRRAVDRRLPLRAPFVIRQGLT